MNQLLELLSIGGPVVWILLVFSITAFTVITLKSWQFWIQLKISHSKAGAALKELENGHSAQATMMLNGQANPRSTVINHTLHLIESSGMALENIRDEAFRKAQKLLNKLSSHLRILEVIATLAPLLGLFGTVLGMIAAFQAMEGAGSQVNPAVLSGGIWQALLTTAVGLAVAIPVSLAHSWFERRIEVESASIQDDLQRIFTVHAHKHEPVSGIRNAS